jgi:hypothetical protein
MSSICESSRRFWYVETIGILGFLIFIFFLDEGDYISVIILPGESFKKVSLTIYSL